MSRFFWAGLALCACPVLAAVAAESPVPADPAAAVAVLPRLTLADAVARVLRDNPALRAAGFTLRAEETLPGVLL